eukprot:TRINITY_DN2223_c0_g5_i1.p1 TRINITY_DN2223_c0_g5~~TRINITY_DN2223_c0_g5_i1.p1  ORF type:complete len:647 (+),score=281.60 TRINITY_DN2223_c0_g5_i1:78-2018(+)
MAARKKEIVYRPNDMVLVARTKGGWSPAVVTAVHEDKKEYAVYFSDQKGRNVCKQISFAAAQVHMKPDDPNAGSEEERGRLLEAKFKLEEMQRYNFYHMAEEDQRSVDVMCGYIQKSGCTVRDACNKYLATLPGSSALSPRAASDLGHYGRPIEDLIEYLIENPGRGPVMTYHDIANWAAAHDPSVAEAFAPAAVPSSGVSAAAQTSMPQLPAATREPSQPPAATRQPSVPAAASESTAFKRIDTQDMSEAIPVAPVPSEPRLPTPPPMKEEDMPGTPSPPHPSTPKAMPPSQPASRQASSIAQPAAEKKEEEDPDVWPRIGKMVEEVEQLDKSIYEMGQIGSPSDDDLQRRDDAIKERSALLMEMAGLFDAMDGTDVVVPFAQEEKLADCFGNVMARGDGEDGATEFTGALLKRVKPDFLHEVLDERNLFVEAVGDGSVIFLSQLLGDARLHSVNAFDIPEIVAGSCYSQMARIPLLEVCLKHLNFKPVADDLSPVLEEFLHAVLDDTKAFPKENRESLVPVVESILSLDFLEIDPCSNDQSGKTMFSKICAGGNLQLLSLFQAKAPAAVQPTAALPDGTTPLIQAVFKDKPDMVTALLKVDGCDVDAEFDIGTALGVASALKREAIIGILKAAGAEKDVFHSEG